MREFEGRYFKRLDSFEKKKRKKQKWITKQKSQYYLWDSTIEKKKLTYIQKYVLIIPLGYLSELCDKILLLKKAHILNNNKVWRNEAVT